MDGTIKLQIFIDMKPGTNKKIKTLNLSKLKISIVVLT